MARSSPTVGGREAQRGRTRDAIVAATVGLLSGGHMPSAAEIAAASRVSRRTVYMYFPRLERLIIEATAAMLSSGAVDKILDKASPVDVRSRVEAMAREVLRLTATTMPFGRRLIALTVETPPRAGSAAARRRGLRRIEWIERALQPLRGRITDEHRQRLVSALMVAIGWESMIVLCDLRGLSRAAAARVSMWMAATVVDAVLAEAAGRRRRPTRTSAIQ